MLIFRNINVLVVEANHLVIYGFFVCFPCFFFLRGVIGLVVHFPKHQHPCFIGKSFGCLWIFLICFPCIFFLGVIGLVLIFQNIMALVLESLYFYECCYLFPLVFLSSVLLECCLSPDIRI